MSFDFERTHFIAMRMSVKRACCPTKYAHVSKKNGYLFPSFRLSFVYICCKNVDSKEVPVQDSQAVLYAHMRRFRTQAAQAGAKNCADQP